MKKDFQIWHREKSGIHAEKERPFFREGEVWFAALGANIGFEQDGSGSEHLRPVVIIRKFNNEIFWAIPLTRTLKNAPFYFSFELNGEQSTAILSQVRLVDAKRLFYQTGTVQAEDMAEMKKRLKALLP